MIETLGKRLREKRLERRLTQSEVAKKVGVKRSAVSQWEADDTQPKGKNLTILCQILDCDINWLQTGKARDKDNLMDGLSSDAIIIIKRVAELDKIDRGKIAAIKTLIGEPSFDI